MTLKYKKLPEGYTIDKTDDFLRLLKKDKEIVSVSKYDKDWEFNIQTLHGHTGFITRTSSTNINKFLICEAYLNKNEYDDISKLNKIKEECYKEKKIDNIRIY